MVLIYFRIYKKNCTFNIVVKMLKSMKLYKKIIVFYRLFYSFLNLDKIGRVQIIAKDLFKQMPSISINGKHYAPYITTVI